MRVPSTEITSARTSAPTALLFTGTDAEIAVSMVAAI